MSADDEQKVLWFEPAEQSPAIPSGAQGLFINVDHVYRGENDRIVLFGAYAFDATTTGKYSEPFPSPIYVVAVAASDGRIYVRDVTDEDDMPVHFSGDDSLPTIVDDDDPENPIIESGYFNLDLADHLGLPAQADRYEVFLWFEDQLSVPVSVDFAQDIGRGEGFTEHRRDSTIAITREGPIEAESVFAFQYREGELRLMGRVVYNDDSTNNHVSIIAGNPRFRSLGWVVIELGKLASMDIMVPVHQLLPQDGTVEQVSVVVISSGRSPQLMTP